tara:strand:+ start:605 stop:1249 length:645 start_codon:yes stop_codon:yes gene_type:complete
MKVIEGLTILLMAAFVFVMTQKESDIVAEMKVERKDMTKQRLEDIASKVASYEKIRTAYIDEVIHDGDPETNKYPVTLNASFSSDADQDEIFYKWRMIDGAPIELSSTTDPVIYFEASVEDEPSEYKFELTVTDTYGAKATYIKTVIIHPEPNRIPAAIFEVTQNESYWHESAESFSYKFATSFREAFRIAREVDGLDQFEWGGKTYNTKHPGE